MSAAPKLAPQASERGVVVAVKPKYKRAHVTNCGQIDCPTCGEKVQTEIDNHHEAVVERTFVCLPNEDNPNQATPWPMQGGLESDDHVDARIDRPLNARDSKRAGEWLMTKLIVKATYNRDELRSQTWIELTKPSVVAWRHEKGQGYSLDVLLERAQERAEGVMRRQRERIPKMPSGEGRRVKPKKNDDGVDPLAMANEYRRVAGFDRRGGRKAVDKK